MGTFLSKFWKCFCGFFSHHTQMYLYSSRRAHWIYRIFGQKWPKMETFRKFWIEKNFSKKIFLPKFWKYFCGFLSYHAYIYLYPSRRVHQMSKSIPILLPPPLGFTKCGAHTNTDDCPSKCGPKRAFRKPHIRFK